MRQSVPDTKVDTGDDAQDSDTLVAERTDSNPPFPDEAADGRLFYDQRHKCLCYLLPLETPRIRATPTRRLRLKASLSGGAASHNAGILAKEPQFWDYLQQINLIAFEGEIDARRARHFINRVCQVTGRHALDRDARAAHRFFDFIESPFLDWLFAAKAC